MIIKAVAWDIDGTLVDSEPLHLRALQHVCNAYNVDIADLADDHFIGVNIEGVWKELRTRFPASIKFRKWNNELNDFYIANKNDLHEIPHAKATIQYFHSLKIPQIAVSNSNRRIVSANLEFLGVIDFFKAIISLDDVLAPKPDPFPYEMAAVKAKIAPKNMLAIEDSLTGARSALSAGCQLAFLGECPPNSSISITSLIELKQLFERDHETIFSLNKA